MRTEDSYQLLTLCLININDQEKQTGQTFCSHQLLFLLGLFVSWLFSSVFYCDCFFSFIVSLVLSLILFASNHLPSPSLLCLNPPFILIMSFYCKCVSFSLLVSLFPNLLFIPSHYLPFLLSSLLHLSPSALALLFSFTLSSHLCLGWLFILSTDYHKQTFLWLFFVMGALPWDQFSLPRFHFFFFIPVRNPNSFLFTLFFLLLLCLWLCLQKWMFENTRGRVLFPPTLKRMNIFYYQLCMRVENVPSVMPYVMFSFASCHFGLYPLIRFRGEQMWFIF